MFILETELAQLAYDSHRLDEFGMHLSIELLWLRRADSSPSYAELPLVSVGYTLDYCEASRAHSRCIEVEIKGLVLEDRTP
ncbi:hypothetical protein PUN28_016856 [Cardiocondyla obscurior]|uniref:Uncharacterized protein n=1 Tax=Cardiocondyla obscurior TaxID=286306 RepID=A0AAW2EP13_9HYME